MIISVDTEKALKKIQYSLMIKKKKTLNTLGVEGKFFNMSKGI